MKTGQGMRTVVIIQARMGSSRLPGKVMMDLGGYPMLAWVLYECLKIDADEVVLAVPAQPESHCLKEVADEFKIETICGPEDNVLGRYVLAARKAKADVIMRITADCPLIEASVCQAVLDVVEGGGVDYCSNVGPRTFPKGLDCEAFTRWALELANRNATSEYDLEHVTAWMQRSEILTKMNVVNSDGKNESAENWCVDTAEDLERVRIEWARRYPKCALSPSTK